MATPTHEGIQQDKLAMAVALALARANEAAAVRGVDVTKSVVTVAEESPPPRRIWRVHYGPRDYLHRRGGDLIVFVDEGAATVQRVVRGQ